MTFPYQGAEANTAVVVVVLFHRTLMSWVAIESILNENYTSPIVLLLLVLRFPSLFSHFLWRANLAQFANGKDTSSAVFADANRIFYQHGYGRVGISCSETSKNCYSGYSDSVSNEKEQSKGKGGRETKQGKDDTYCWFNNTNRVTKRIDIKPSCSSGS